jgi:hypothetical protein
VTELTWVARTWETYHVRVILKSYCYHIVVSRGGLHRGRDHKVNNSRRTSWIDVHLMSTMNSEKARADRQISGLKLPGVSKPLPNRCAGWDYSAPARVFAHLRSSSPCKSRLRCIGRAFRYVLGESRREALGGWRNWFCWIPPRTKLYRP